MPPPQGDPDAPLQALIIDSWFDNYVGVVHAGARGRRRARAEGQDPARWRPARHLCEQRRASSRRSRKRATALAAGEVGFVIAGIKELQAAQGRRHRHPASNARRREPLPGFKEIKPQVFAGLYPVEANEYEALREALEKLHLNDASLRYEPETSQALGFGFRCGFLGLLHMDIVQERLEREYGMELITTAPTVVYQVRCATATCSKIENPSKLPDPSKIEEIREPIITRHDLHAAGVRRAGDHAVHQKRGVQTNMQYLGAPGDAHLRAAAERNRDGFLRQAEVDDARLRVARLRVQGIPRRPIWSSSTS